MTSEIEIKSAIRIKVTVKRHMITLNYQFRLLFRRFCVKIASPNKISHSGGSLEENMDEIFC